MSKQKIEKQRMATIVEVYNRIIWDANLNRNMFIAGFYERISETIREKPLAQWDDNSDIPWHRVRYIRCGETIVWDREHRIDLISTNSLPDLAWKSEKTEASRADLAALVANNQGEFTTRSIYYYDGNSWRVFTGGLKSIDLKSKLTVVSYNILSNLYDADLIYTDWRLPIILSELAKTDADIIALQEVTPESLAFILATDWVRDYFISESVSGNCVKPYGNLIMSRWAFNLVEHQFSAHKRVLVSSWNINDRSVHLANIHLTSNRGDNALQKRTQQLATVIGYLEQQAGDRLIVGDFNTRGDEQSEIIKYGNFSDLWEKLHPDRAGYTIDPATNSLSMLMSLEGEPARFDRILWCGEAESHYQPLSIDLFGCKPFGSNDAPMYPSDHFGVCGVFKISQSVTPNTPSQGVDLTTIAPVYESILAIIPPEDLFPPIQAIRQQYDAGFVRIVPHITLLYGFLPDRYFEEVVDLIAPILAKIPPFTVTLADFQIFTHHKTVTAYLRPIIQPEGALHELQEILYRLFPQCYEQSTKTAAGFNPHLSVGQFANPNEAEAKLPQWHPLKFTVNSVAVVSRRRDEACVVRHLVGVGKLLPKVVENSELIDLINRLEPELTDVQNSQRETVLAVVKQACTECLEFSWSLLCAYSYINYHDRDKSLERLLANFFQIFSQHNWKYPIALTDLGRQYIPKSPQDLLPIVSSIAPCKNTARNVTSSTAKILQNEFIRGAETIDLILANKANWISLYEPINLSIESNLLLTITITHLDENELINSTNTLEACIVGLIIELEQTDIFVRPYPQIDRSKTTSKFSLFLNLPSNCESTRVEQIVADFIVGGSRAFALAIASPWRIELMDLTIAQS